MSDPMTILTEGEFVDEPPEATRAGGRPPGVDWKTVADDLRAHPNQWRKVAENAPANLAWKIENGTIAAFRRTGPDVIFEAVARNFDSQTRRADIWARALS